MWDNLMRATWVWVLRSRGMVGMTQGVGQLTTLPMGMLVMRILRNVGAKILMTLGTWGLVVWMVLTLQKNPMIILLPMMWKEVVYLGIIILRQPNTEPIVLGVIRPTRKAF
jgi:hypothetical protein